MIKKDFPFCDKISGAGFIAGVDSGDPVSHESLKGDKHTALNGLALAIL